MPVDSNVFVMRLMRQVLERKSIQWSPGRRIGFQPLDYTIQDGYLESRILSIAIALEKLSSIEYQWDVEEFEHLCPMLGPFDEDFRDFFVYSVSSCYLNSYSPFNFIRYLRYITDFAVFCFCRGFPDALNQAAISICLVIFQNAHVFMYMSNWTRLINEAERILMWEFVHPYTDNQYLWRINASQ